MDLYESKLSLIKVNMFKMESIQFARIGIFRMTCAIFQIFSFRWMLLYILEFYFIFIRLILNDNQDCLRLYVSP